MANLNMATGAVLGTIVTTAETVSNIFSSVSTGAQMINDFASNARKNQLTNIKLSAVGYEETLRVNKALEIDEAQTRLKEYIGGDQDKADRIAKIMSEFDKALA